jgi:hypothetical protein
VTEGTGDTEIVGVADAVSDAVSHVPYSGLQPPAMLQCVGVEPQKKNLLQQSPGLHEAPPAAGPHAMIGDRVGDGDGGAVFVGVMLFDGVRLVEGVCVGVMLMVGDGVAELQKPNAVWQPLSIAQ